MSDEVRPENGNRKLGNLRMVWDFAIRYPGRIAFAALSLLVAAAATLAIPNGFRLVIDRGFAAAGGDVGRWFEYLLMIVSVLAVATASRFHFALRKIIESVAVGCAPITNLPAWDVLPEIDEALVRVPDSISTSDLRSVIDEAERAWDLDRARHFAARACDFYDYRAAGLRLDAAIRGLVCACS